MKLPSATCIRPGINADFSQIREWDEFWGDRRQELQRAEVYVATNGAECIGYARLSRNEFLNYPLVAAVCVKRAERRAGVGLALLKHIETLCSGLRVFSTTEVTNEPMLCLFLKAGFQNTGYVDYLNSDGSREIIFTKLCGPNDAEYSAHLEVAVMDKQKVIAELEGLEAEITTLHSLVQQAKEKVSAGGSVSKDELDMVVERIARLDGTMRERRDVGH